MNPQHTEVQEILNRHDVAKLLGVSLTQVERFKKAGKLPYIKLSHKWDIGVVIAKSF